jgi:hypothetical protein
MSFIYSRVEIRMGYTITTIPPAKRQVEYYFVAPGKKHIEYGVLTDVDLLGIAHEYFGTPAK